MAFLTVLLSLNDFRLDSKDGIAVIEDAIALLTKWHNILRESLTAAIDNSDIEALSIKLKNAFEAYKNGLEQTAAETIVPPMPSAVDNSDNNNEDSNNSEEGCGSCCQPS